jgi:hypothetical protein
MVFGLSRKYESKVVGISQPHRVGMDDRTVYVEEDLRDKIPHHGKKVITDQVYVSKAEPEDHSKLALPILRIIRSL